MLSGSFILMRHGNRYPIKRNHEFHNFLYKKYKIHNAKLTSIGLKESKEIGLKLAKYFKQKKFNGQLYYSTTKKFRTKQTKNEFLKGSVKIYKKKPIKYNLKYNKEDCYRNYKKINRLNVINK